MKRRTTGVVVPLGLLLTGCGTLVVITKVKGTSVYYQVSAARG